jgi:hypothetical protein
MLFGHTWEWYLTEAAVGIGSLISVFLVVYYIRLIRINKEMLHAAQTEYAPSLDISIHPHESYCGFEIINRGMGTARNIELQVTVQIRGTTYQNCTVFEETSLRPDHKLLRPDSLPSSQPNSPAVYLDIRTCEKTSEGEETFPLVDLLTRIAPEEGADKAHIVIRARYTDLSGNATYERKVMDKDISTEEDNLDDIFGPVTVRESRVIPNSNIWNLRIQLSQIVATIRRRGRRAITLETPPIAEDVIHPIQVRAQEGGRVTRGQHPSRSDDRSTRGEDDVERDQEAIRHCESPSAEREQAGDQ